MNLPRTIIIAITFVSCTVMLFAGDQNDWEKKFRSIPNTDSLRAFMQRVSARPHHLGSAYDRDNAEWILAKMKSYGMDAHIESFEVLFPTPKERLVELVSPVSFRAALQEPALEVDPTSQQTDEQLPTYNAYSIDGDVTGPLVYVNYGIPEDYKQLELMGISVKGCIVIARYGGSWRGIKPKVAGEHGAIGCLIYSDPKGDGYTQGDVFPDGPFRPAHGVQRGSVMDMPLYPGDPLTPGIAATADAKRLSVKEARTITTIPVLPLSYEDARPLLAALTGPVAPSDWCGTLPITYHIGPGTAKVHMKVKSSWDMVKVNDVIGTIPGSTYPDEWILRGNHQDAWVNGAEDPVSGLVALLEEARSFGELLKMGWKPQRTITYCVWDGEEQGLIGSTEWVEKHAQELRKNAVAYVNSDATGRGYLFVLGSHSLEHFINDVAADIADPETGRTVAERLRLQRIREAPTSEARAKVRQRQEIHVSPVGSGSDYTAFLDHLGIASLNLGFGGEDDGGIYHSIYDDFYWYTHFSDTSFVYGRALSQTAGTAVMRLSEARVLPFAFTNLADELSVYAKEVEDLLAEKQEKAKETNKQIAEGVFSATIDPWKKQLSPPMEDVPPYLNFAPLHNAMDALHKSADRYRLAPSASLPDAVVRSVNQKLIKSERALTDARGLPGRPWFTHHIYAPGFYTGYGVKTLPGVREAIEQHAWKTADEHIARVASLLVTEAAIIDAAAAEMENAGK